MKKILPYLLLLMLTALVACENDPAEVGALTRKVKEVEEGKNIKGVFSQSAELKAELSSPLMLRVKSDTMYTEFPNSLHVDFYSNKLKESEVNARYGKYYDQLNKIYLRDSVVIYKITGDTLYCDDLWWDQNQNIFYTNKPVRIMRPTDKLKGSGLWALANFKKYTIHDAKGLVDVPESIQP